MTIINAKERLGLQLLDARIFVEGLLNKGTKYVNHEEESVLSNLFDFDRNELDPNDVQPYIVNETKYAILYAGELTVAEQWYNSLTETEKRHVDFLIRHNQIQT
jgi:hypothetical protein